MARHILPIELIDSSDEDENINPIPPLEPILIEGNGKKYYCMLN